MKAIDIKKPTYIFIEKNVLSEYETYSINKNNNSIKYRFIDDIKIYQFIDQITVLPNNNPIHPFESSEDIIAFLKEQWAGLFQRFLNEQTRFKEINLLEGIQNTAATLNQLILFLTEEKKGKETVINDLLLSNHPAMERLKSLLGVNYRVYFLNKTELNNWLKARNYTHVSQNEWDNENEEQWVCKKSNKQFFLKISTELFDDNGNLKAINQDNWNDDLIRLEETDFRNQKEDDLPI
jgi:hypothetical protein